MALIADRAYEELRDRIVTLKLPPGMVLREDELMAELAIGRTPLRDAIKRLALEGLVAVQPRRGTTITAGRLLRHHAYHRGARDLEGLAAELAALRMTAGRGPRGRAPRAAAALGRGTDPDELMRMDTEIHRFMWDARRTRISSRPSSATSRCHCASGTCDRPRAGPRRLGASPGAAAGGADRPRRPRARAASCASTCSSSSARCSWGSAAPRPERVVRAAPAARHAGTMRH